MNIIHTADLHLGHLFHRYARQTEHRHFFDWLRQTVARQRADVLIVSGDVFDHPYPSAELQRMFFDFLIAITEENQGLQIVVTAGANDAGTQLEAAEEMLRRHNIYVRGTVARTADGAIDFDRLILPLARRGEQEASIVCYAIPFLRPHDYPAGMSMSEGMKFYFQQLDKQLKRSAFRSLPVVAIAHAAIDGAGRAKNRHSEQSATQLSPAIAPDALPNDYAYIALGGIHRSQEIDGRENVRYAGSPLPMSFGERNLRHSIIAAEIDERGKAHLDTIVYEPLCSLLRLPNDGTADPNETMRLIDTLPPATHNSDPSTWSYLELHLRAEQPEPELRRRLFERLRGKAVRLCRIATPLHENDIASGNQLPSLENKPPQLRPLDIARQFYREQHGAEMPQELERRFRLAERSIELAEPSIEE